jgi:chromosome segregation ATPase
VLHRWRNTAHKISTKPAQAAHAAALKQVKQVQEACEHAWEVVMRADGKLEAAQKALQTAKESESELVAAVALGETDTGLTSVAEAEASATQATNDLAVARRTREALEQRLRREEAEVKRLSGAIERAVVAVVKADPPVAALLAEQEQVNRRMGELVHILSFLGSSASFVSSYGFWPDAADARCIDPYRAWLAALETDADATFPGG